MSQMQQMAILTGNSKPATSIAGNVGFNCEYDLFGKKFWVFSPTICPVSIYVKWCNDDYQNTKLRYGPLRANADNISHGIKNSN